MIGSRTFITLAAMYPSSGGPAILTPQRRRPASRAAREVLPESVLNTPASFACECDSPLLASGTACQPGSGAHACLAAHTIHYQCVRSLECVAPKWQDITVNACGDCVTGQADATDAPINPLSRGRWRLCPALLRPLGPAPRHPARCRLA